MLNRYCSMVVVVSLLLGGCVSGGGGGDGGKSKNDANPTIAGRYVLQDFEVRTASGSVTPETSPGFLGATLVLNDDGQAEYATVTANIPARTIEHGSYFIDDDYFFLTLSDGCELKFVYSLADTTLTMFLDTDAALACSDTPYTLLDVWEKE